MLELLTRSVEGAASVAEVYLVAPTSQSVAKGMEVVRLLIFVFFFVFFKVQRIHGGAFSARFMAFVTFRGTLKGAIQVFFFTHNTKLRQQKNQPRTDWI